MNNIIGSFEDTIEKGAQAASSAVQKQAAGFVKTAVGQVTGGQTTNSNSNSDQGTNENNNTVQAQKPQMSDDQAKQFLRDLYGPTKPASSDQQKTTQGSSTPSQNPVAQAIGLTPTDPNKGKTPEEVAQMQSLRNQLHADYYQNLVNRPKAEPEHVTEKLEREEQQAQFEEIEKDKKKPQALPQTVKQGTGESVVGVSG